MYFLAVLLALAGMSFGEICRPLQYWYADRERGWFFGEWCEKEEKKEEEQRTVKVPWDKLDRMHWKEVRKLVEEVKAQAVANPTYENVREWKRLVLWMAKKGMDFMRMDRIVTLTSGDVYVVSRGSPYYNRRRIQYTSRRIPIVERFREETGWEVLFVNVRENPKAALRLGVRTVPDTFVVVKKGEEYVWQRAGTGAFTLDVLKENVIIALSVLKEVSYEEVFGEPQSSYFGR